MQLGGKDPLLLATKALTPWILLLLPSLLYISANSFLLAKAHIQILSLHISVVISCITCNPNTPPIFTTSSLSSCNYTRPSWYSSLNFVFILRTSVGNYYLFLHFFLHHCTDSMSSWVVSHICESELFVPCLWTAGSLTGHTYGCKCSVLQRYLQDHPLWL